MLLSCSFVRQAAVTLVDDPPRLVAWLVIDAGWCVCVCARARE